jgi:hypothetical protein
LVFNCANCVGLCLIGGDFIGSFCGELKYGAPSVNCAGDRSIRGFGLGLTGGGVRVRCFASGALSTGSGGSLNARCGLGDRTGGGECWARARDTAARFVGVAGRFCSNILTREVVGGIGVSSVGFCSCPEAREVLATECDPRLSRLFCGCLLGSLDSSLASTLPTLPDGGRTSLAFTCRSLITGDMAA